MLSNCLAACAHLTTAVSEIQRDICGKNRHLIIPSWGGGGGISATPLVRKNYNGVATRRQKKFEDMFIRCDVIHERDRRTDRRTDGQTLHDSMTALV